MQIEQPERIPKLLAIAGALPIALVALMPPQLFNAMTLFGFLYLTLIYSFLGGVNWGVGLQEKDDTLYWLGVIPPILSLVMIYLYSLLTKLHTTIWGVLIIAFIWQCLFDLRLIKQDILPSWYRSVRLTGTTLLVIFSLICVIRMVLISA